MVGKNLLAIAVMAALASSAHGALLVTEFMADPSGTDIDREWFEIYNSGTTAIDLTGYAAGDGTDSAGTSTGEGMGVFPSGTMIASGQVMVIAANANGFKAFYGFAPNFEFANSTSTLGLNPDVPDLVQKSGWGNSAGSLGIANGSDDIAIIDPDGNVVDGVSYGTITTFTTLTFSGTNATWERVPANVDTNTASDWVLRTSGNATPGVVTVPEPVSASVLGAVAGVGLLGTRVRRRK